MSASLRTVAGVGLLLALASAGPARAQCPDGTLPPCREASIVRPARDLRDRQAASRGVLAERLSALRRGDFADAARRMCAALTVLPESLATWPVPGTCAVYSSDWRGRGVFSAELLDTIMRRLTEEGSVRGLSVEPQDVGPWGQLQTLWIAFSFGHDSTRMRGEAEQRAFILAIRDTVFAVGLISDHRRFRDLVADGLARALGHSLEVAPGASTAYRRSLATTFPVPVTNVSAQFDFTPLEEALRAFASPTLRFVVEPTARRVRVTSLIRDRRWGVALTDLLDAFGLIAVQEDERTIRVRLAR